jgi:hypothetical protein
MYRTGYCGTARHDLCAGTYAGTACDCACHTTPAIPTPRTPEPPPPLSPVTVTVRCFFGCPATIASTEPGEAHAAMEGHYWSAHREQIALALWGAA